MKKEIKKNVTLFENDIDPDFLYSLLGNNYVSIDIETSGLDWKEDKIATIQIFTCGNIAIIKIQNQDYSPDNLIHLFKNKNVLKIFHHAMFDIRFMTNKWGRVFSNIACTKVASKLVNNKAKDHSLKKLLRDRLQVGIQKELWSSNWFKSSLTDAQVKYAVDDVRYLRELYRSLKREIEKEQKTELMQACFDFIPKLAWLQVNGYEGVFEY
ncbi:ribonuclease D [Fodinibius roseus]|uniref:Ribonuclease D n=1 Tax=Fodinibius roseus TaxID=1194090 RepID=A0A1M5I9P1_9BACT|nr:ribonuclease H-like domain-containing protein [Fodinibius roseus]SHG24947.1 ribonuclease D [Fodinibius roseus]